MTNVSWYQSSVRHLWGPRASAPWCVAATVAASFGAAGLALALDRLSFYRILAFLVVAIGASLLLGMRRIEEGLIAVIAFETVIPFDLNLAYDTGAAARGAVGGLSISPSAAALLGLVALRLVRGRRTRGNVAAWPVPQRLAFALLIVFGLSMIAAQDRQLASFQLVAFGQGVLILWLTASAKHPRRTVHWLTGAFLAATALHGILAIGAKSGILTASFRGPLLIDGRYVGMLQSPNATAVSLEFLIILAIACVLNPAFPNLWPLALVSLPLGAVALVLTASRGGWLAAAVALGLFLIGSKRRGWLSTRALVTITAFAALIALPVADLVASRLTQSDEGAAQSRVPLLHVAFRMIKDRPLGGVGLNNYVLVMDDYLSPELADSWRYVVHNRYLQVWAEGGFVALMLFLLFLGSIVIVGYQAVGVSDGSLGMLALGMVTAVVGSFAHMMVDIFQARPQIQSLMLAAAFVLLIDRERRKGVPRGSHGRSAEVGRTVDRALLRQEEH